MKTSKLSSILTFTALSALLITSCDKADDLLTGQTLPNIGSATVMQLLPNTTNGLYVLNEGKMNGNNASLTLCNLSTLISYNDFFSGKNNRGLGDTGQDMIKYGSKIYIAVSTSSLIEVIDANSGVSLKTISMVNESSEPRKPRSLVSLNGNVYISLYDGHVARLDTTSLSIEKTIAVGSNPEQIISANNKLYVANSSSDSTISVIDPVSFTETKKIKVAINPTKIKADKYGNLYVISMGDYGYTTPVTLQRIDASTENVTTISGITPYNMAVEGDNLYLYGYDYDANWNVVNKKYLTYNVLSKTLSNTDFITSSTISGIPYSIDVNPTTKDIFIGETVDYKTPGKMYCFSQDGTLKYSFATGVNPSKTVFLNK